MIFRLLAGREVRNRAGSPTHVGQMPPILDTGEVPLVARASFLAADRDHDAERLDVVAGCEFVDDRIRLLE